MLAIPAAESIRAKLFSAAAESRGVPSSSNWSPEAASSRPASSSEPSAVRNSLQAVSYCLAVRGWPNSYILANLSRMFRLRTKARAAAGRALLIVCVIFSWGRAACPTWNIEVWSQNGQWYPCPVWYWPMVLLGGRSDFSVNGRKESFFEPGFEFSDIPQDHPGSQSTERLSTSPARLAVLRQDADKRNLRRLGRERVVDVVADVQSPGRLATAEYLQQTLRVRF